jgi:hypothetical protein
MQPYVAMKGALISLTKNDALGLRGGWHPGKRHLSSSCKDSHASAMGRGGGELKLTSPPILDRIHPLGNSPKGDVMADAERTRFYEN